MLHTQWVPGPIQYKLSIQLKHWQDSTANQQNNRGITPESLSLPIKPKMGVITQNEWSQTAEITIYTPAYQC